MNLITLRNNIDSIDLQIAKLLTQRTNISEEIGILKARTGLPVRDHSREQEVLERVSNHASTSNEIISVRRVFATILADSRRLQTSSMRQAIESAEDCK